ncbi:hypothetical protein CDG60_12335 [Acinetobacter chinensis]|uniref:Uncharacterized protein n=1 Tax=Acinetobacter chinensis TaxID=2004650 RepID=A0A3B7LZ47_9GAMM|nr:hypothetical protein [Acinetobacter chinensis]AXY57285.1 hypothetical protein CDG60_12335 [Acinetobacter chinensis]
MEKYLKLLSPKSINYEADRIDGGIPSLQAQDVLLAMSYAKLTPLQDNLLRLKYFGANTKANIELFSSVLVSRFESNFNGYGVPQVYHRSILKIALMEFCLVPGGYKPSKRNRAVLCGFSDTTVFIHMMKRVDEVLELFNLEMKIAEVKIFTQISKLS